MSSRSFRLEEATIDNVHSAFKEERISCRKLVELQLARIDAYDKKGPEINSIITINPKALEEAETLDRKFKRTGKLVGPLHGITVLVKDQVETKDMPTTFGSIAFRDYMAKDDATVIKKLRQAGAIILGKTNLPDWATSWFCFSSAGGETKNPYALDRNPGGSSGGTGAAIAANFGTVGIGEDTGGSIRVPSSFNNLFGIKVTPGMISRTGMSPLVTLQDSAGPMTRTVKDLAILMDALVGYDPADPFTVTVLCTKIPESYTNYLVEDGLKGARIGILREAFGPDEDPDAKKVNEIINKAIEAMRNQGAEIVDPVSIPNLIKFIVGTALYVLESKYDINSFLAERPDAPVHSVEELYEARRFHPLLDLFADIAKAPANPEALPEYHKGIVDQGRFQRAVLNVMAPHRLDAIAFPDVKVLPPLQDDIKNWSKWTTLTFPTNTLIGAQTKQPAISVPAGFTEEGVPVGLELLGKPYDEPTLIKLAYSLEQAISPRKLPESTPPLPGS